MHFTEASIKWIRTTNWTSPKLHQNHHQWNWVFFFKLSAIWQHLDLIIFMSMTFYGLTLKSMKISSESQGAVSTAVIICFSPTRCKPSMHSFWKRKKICPFLDSTTHIHYSSLWIHIIRYNHSFTGQVQMTSVDEAHKFVTKNHAFNECSEGKKYL